ncbi:MAG: c-type cytochrome [Polymorphobacter sp.]
MDSFEFNKIAGWLLAATLSVLAIGIITDGMYHPVKPEKQSYIVEGVEVEVADAGPAEVAKPIAFYLASADVTKGEAVFKKCGACHNNAKGGAAGIGPNLYGIVGKPHAAAAGFAYSEALGAMKGKPWSWDELNAWLTNPKAYAPGNKMSFAGISKPEDRAAVLAYLNSKSDSPMPMPAVPAEVAAPAEAAPEAAAPAAEAAPAEAAPAEAAPAPAA